VYQHEHPGASGFDAPFRRFAGAELEDLLLAKALECFAHGWSLPRVQDRIFDWHLFKARPGAFLDDDEVEAIVARAEKMGTIIPQTNVVYLESARASRARGHNRTITVDRPGYTGTPMEVKITRE